MVVSQWRRSRQLNAPFAYSPGEHVARRQCSNLLAAAFRLIRAIYVRTSGRQESYEVRRSASHPVQFLCRWSENLRFGLFVRVHQRCPRVLIPRVRNRCIMWRCELSGPYWGTAMEDYHPHTKLCSEDELRCRPRKEPRLFVVGLYVASVGRIR